jgi:hypothetical protein
VEVARAAVGPGQLDADRLAEHVGEAHAPAAVGLQLQLELEEAGDLLGAAEAGQQQGVAAQRGGHGQLPVRLYIVRQDGSPFRARTCGDLARP